MKKVYIIAALAAGIIGCLCFGGGDWLMIYGDMTSVPLSEAFMLPVFVWLNEREYVDFLCDYFFCGAVLQ